MNSKEQAKNLIDEISMEVNGDLDGWFDNGKKIALLLLRKNYTVQQKTRLIDALEKLEYEPE